MSSNTTIEWKYGSAELDQSSRSRRTSRFTPKLMTPSSELCLLPWWYCQGRMTVGYSYERHDAALVHLRGQDDMRNPAANRCLTTHHVSGPQSELQRSHVSFCSAAILVPSSAWDPSQSILREETASIENPSVFLTTCLPATTVARIMHFSWFILARSFYQSQ